MRNEEKEMREPGVSMASEKSLLEFARSYLSEAFPNPERAGCPPDSALRLMATQPKEADASVSEHLTCCSPCFNRYMDLLAQLEPEKERGLKKVFTWAIASPLRAAAALGLALGLGIGTYVVVDWLKSPAPIPLPPPEITEPPSPPTYAQFVVDMSGLSPVRGEEVGPTAKTTARIPQSPLDLTLYLPLGSEEGTYAISLKAEEKTLWSASAEARLHKQKMTLQVKADLSRVAPGKYVFEVESPSGVRLKQPVSLQGKEVSKP